MTLYHLGNVKMGPTVTTDCYFVEKKSGCFLLLKNNTRTKQIYHLYKGDSFATLYFKPEATDVEYKNIKDYNFILRHINDEKYISVERIVKAIAHHKELLDRVTEINPAFTPKSEKKEEEQIVYNSPSGVELKGTLRKIQAICVSLDEIFDVKNIKGHEGGEYYYSQSKNEWIKIVNMNTAHIMNSLIKQIRDYYDGLKINSSTTIEEFMDQLQKWTDDKIIQNLSTELGKRMVAPKMA